MDIGNIMANLPLDSGQRNALSATQSLMKQSGTETKDGAFFKIFTDLTMSQSIQGLFNDPNDNQDGGSMFGGSSNMFDSNSWLNLAGIQGNNNQIPEIKNVVVNGDTATVVYADGTEKSAMVEIGKSGDR